jgi:hypothetical protein
MRTFDRSTIRLQTDDIHALVVAADRASSVIAGALDGRPGAKIKPKARATAPKARIDKRIAEVKADFDVRSKKLNQAWTLTKEALAA